MLGAIARKLFGTPNDRTVKQLGRRAAEIGALADRMKAMSDEDLRGQTARFRQRLADGETVDDLLVEAFATAREAADRVLGLRPFDVQIVGAIVLHEGKIAEMKTGEGKTLVATLPIYLNALSGQGCHVVTVNDYLAQRDAAWMGRVYEYLGLTVGCIVHGLDDAERRRAYAADVTYGTNNELGFDYLRDNMKPRLEEMVQRPFHYAIVDEVDSILIDEARTPLVISGPAQTSSELYTSVNGLIPKLADDDFELDEKQRTVTLTEEGQETLEVLLRESGMLQEGSLYDAANIPLLHHATQSLRAHKLFQRDRDYIVKDGRVVIIDEFTGRMMEGRRFSEGLHQALEAREGVPIQRETQTFASITFQNYFRLYPKLAGMTGTAMTEAPEFAEIYGLEVVEIPTNVSVNRTDEDDEVYRTTDEKFKAILELIGDCHQRGQPTLVGTVSIEKSEQLSTRLKGLRIPHNVLNARHHEQEAMIIARAGEPGAVTIATNMAGRGTDIQLGGNLQMRLKTEAEPIEDPAVRARKEEEIRREIAERRQTVIEAGGLCVVGTERHESRRIDNQLRGRSGRQGDPGRSCFFLSLQDDLMRIFAPERLDSMLRKLGLDEGEAIVHPWISKALERAQSKVEARNFEIRKNLLRFDNVMNDQRRVVYEQRREIMAADDVQPMIADMRQEVLSDMVTAAIPPNSYAEKWDVDGLTRACSTKLGLDLPIADWAREEGIAEPEIEERVATALDQRMAEKAAQHGPEMMRAAEKQVLLRVLDTHWREHLLLLDHLRQGIQLRAYGQRDPLREYQSEAFEIFQGFLARLREQVTSMLATTEFRPVTMDDLRQQLTNLAQQASEGRLDPALAADAAGPRLDKPAPGAGGTAAAGERPQPVRRGAAGVATIDPADPETWGKVPRNAPCPCGSGRKFKHCHGAV